MERNKFLSINTPSKPINHFHWNKFLIAIVFEVLIFDEWCCMILSSILHYPNLLPAFTFSVFEYVLHVIIMPPSCNTGTYTSVNIRLLYQKWSFVIQINTGKNFPLFWRVLAASSLMFGVILKCQGCFRIVTAWGFQWAHTLWLPQQKPEKNGFKVAYPLKSSLI